MVSSTGSNNTYTYHKLLGKEDDIKQLSDDINDFAARYRVASSAPSSSLDNGDLWYDTSNAKMMVYSTANSQWEEVSSTGDFYINTISSYSGTGGNSATFNGSAYRFTLSNPPSSAQQLVVSVNGVVQKPNSGTGQPSEGFAINGSTIVFSAAPATSSPYFIITVGSTVAIGTPSDNTVSTAKIQNAAVTNEKIQADAVTASKIGVLDATLQFGDNVKAQFGAGNDLQIWHDATGGNYSYIFNYGAALLKIGSDQDIILGKTGNETFINAKADGAVELHYDGGTKKFETTSTGVKYTGDLRADDDYRIKLGTSQELNIYHHNSGVSVIGNTNQTLKLRAKEGEDGVVITPDGSVDLYHDNSKKLETHTTGVVVYGNISPDNLYLGDNEKAYFGAGSDLQIYHNGTDSYLLNSTGRLLIPSAEIDFMSADQNEWIIKSFQNGAVELYYDNSKKLETKSSGVGVTGNLEVGSGQITCGVHGTTGIQIIDDGTFGTLHSADLKLRTASATRVTIDTSGNVGIGTTSPTSYYATNLVVNGGAGGGITIVGGTTNSNFLCFADGTSGDARYSGYVGYDHNSDQLNIRGNNGQKGIDIQSSGNLSITDGNLVLASGHGVLFYPHDETTSTPGSDSNLLDDYEEGTFSPILRAHDSSTGQVTGTGTYIRVGKIVHLRISFNNKACGSIPNSAVIKIDDLPFVCDLMGQDGNHTSSVVMTHNVVIRPDQTFYSVDNTDYLLGIYNNSGTGWSNWSTDDFNQGAVYVEFCMSMTVD